MRKFPCHRRLTKTRPRVQPSWNKGFLPDSFSLCVALRFLNLILILSPQQYFLSSIPFQGRSYQKPSWLSESSAKIVLWETTRWSDLMAFNSIYFMTHLNSHQLSYWGFLELRLLDCDVSYSNWMAKRNFFRWKRKYAYQTNVRWIIKLRLLDLKS